MHACSATTLRPRLRSEFCEAISGLGGSVVLELGVGVDYLCDAVLHENARRGCWFFFNAPAVFRPLSTGMSRSRNGNGADDSKSEAPCLHSLLLKLSRNCCALE